VARRRRRCRPGNFGGGRDPLLALGAACHGTPSLGDFGRYIRAETKKHRPLLGGQQGHPDCELRIYRKGMVTDRT